MHAGRLCADLCDALLRVTLELPPLRERRGDVPALVKRMLDDRAARGERPCRVTTEAMVHLWEHDWPGNVRELRQLIESVASASRDGLIHAADLPDEMRRTAHRVGPRPPLGSIGIGSASRRSTATVAGLRTPILADPLVPLPRERLGEGSNELFDESEVEAIVSFPHLASAGGRGGRIRTPVHVFCDAGDV